MQNSALQTGGPPDASLGPASLKCLIHTDFTSQVFGMLQMFHGGGIMCGGQCNVDTNVRDNCLTAVCRVAHACVRTLSAMNPLISCAAVPASSLGLQPQQPGQELNVDISHLAAWDLVFSSRGLSRTAALALESAGACTGCMWVSGTLEFGTQGPTCQVDATWTGQISMCDQAGHIHAWRDWRPVGIGVFRSGVHMWALGYSFYVQGQEG